MCHSFNEGKFEKDASQNEGRTIKLEKRLMLAREWERFNINLRITWIELTSRSRLVQFLSISWLLAELEFLNSRIAINWSSILLDCWKRELSYIIARIYCTVLQWQKQKSVFGVSPASDTFLKWREKLHAVLADLPRATILPNYKVIAETVWNHEELTLVCCNLSLPWSLITRFAKITTRNLYLKWQIDRRLKIQKL